MPPMASSLTSEGVLWALLSLVASLTSATGFYAPFWIRGALSDGTEVSFGSFRRCNYPRLTAGGALVVVRECGRYTRFSDIPSASWRAATVLTGVGAGLALLVAFTALSACCLRDVVTKATARILGLVQLVAALLLSCGCCIYPNGWSSREVRDVCGTESDAYRLGACHFSWSLYLLWCSVGVLLVCVVLSLRASRVKPNSFRICHPQPMSFEMQIRDLDEEDIATITRGAVSCHTPYKGVMLQLKTQQQQRHDGNSLWMASLCSSISPRGNGLVVFLAATPQPISSNSVRSFLLPGFRDRFRTIRISSVGTTGTQIS